MVKKKRQGQSLIEYGLVIGLMCVVGLSAVNAFGSKVSVAGQSTSINVQANAASASVDADGAINQSLSTILSGESSSIEEDVAPVVTVTASWNESGLENDAEDISIGDNT